MLSGQIFHFKLDLEARKVLQEEPRSVEPEPEAVNSGREVELAASHHHSNKSLDVFTRLVQYFERMLKAQQKN